MRAWIAMLGVLGTAGCDDLGDAEPCDGYGGGTIPSCNDVPELCSSPVTSTVLQPDLERAIDIVFVGDGFTEAELPAYRDRVDDLIHRLRSIDDYVASHPIRFNFHRVDVISPTSHLTNGDRTDTALGGCVRRDSHSGDWWLDSDGGLISLAAHRAPDADVVVDLMNLDGGRPNADPGTGPMVPSTVGNAAPIIPRTVRISLEDGGETVLHELGHALFGLADEYSEGGEYHPAWAFSTDGDPLVQPNVTLDRHGRKWRALVDGAEEGGLRYDEGVYHPGRSCRMRNATEPFCPVCKDRIQHVLDAFAQPLANDGPPRCAIYLSQRPDQVTGALSAAVIGYDENVAVLGSLRLDDELVLDGTRGTSPRSFELFAVTQVIDTTALANGAHAFVARCLDGTGLVSEVSVTITIAN